MPFGEDVDTREQSLLDIRLVEAAQHAQTMEVILVLRGRIRRAPRGRRWLLRDRAGRVVTFASEWVAAVTPIPPQPAPTRA